MAEPNASTDRTTAHVDRDGVKHYGVMAREVADREAQTPIAVLMLVVSTPVMEDPTPEYVAKNLEDNAAQAAKRASAIRALADKGWVMQRPFVMPDVADKDDGFEDVVIFFRKGFPDSDAAEREARECGCSTHDDSWSIGWKDQGSVNQLGLPDCESWGEV